MNHCSACFKNNIISKLRTIGDQIVCSLACVGLLNSNEHDSCDYCHRPVWRDSYYIVNNKFYCTEICKDKIISELKIPYDSKSIQYFQENIFFNDNNIDCISNLNNSKQLREEVLKFYKDFQFDSIIENEKINKKKETISNKKSYKNENEYLSDSNKGNHRYFKRIRRNDVQEGKTSQSKNTINLEESINNSKSKNLFETTINTTDDKNCLKKVYTLKNLKNKEDKTNILRYRTKRIKVDKLNKKIYNTYIDNNYGQEKILYSDKSLPNKIFSNNKNKNGIKSYSFINSINYTNANNSSRNLRNNSNYNTIKTNVSDSSSKGIIYININKNKTNSVRRDETHNYCCHCGNELGRSSFLDRKGNHFCSDYCKEEFLKNGF